MNVRPLTVQCSSHAATPLHRRRGRNVEQVDDRLDRVPQSDHLFLGLEQRLPDLLLAPVRVLDAAPRGGVRLVRVSSGSGLGLGRGLR